MKHRYIVLSVVGIVVVVLLSIGYFAFPPLIEDGAHCIRRGYAFQIDKFSWTQTTHYEIFRAYQTSLTNSELRFVGVWVDGGTISDISGELCLQIQDSQGKVITVIMSERMGPAEFYYERAQNPTRWTQLTPPFNVTVYAQFANEQALP